MMTIPSLAGIERLELPEKERQFLSFFAGIVDQYPHNRMLLFAWIFCLRLCSERIECIEREFFGK